MGLDPTVAANAAQFNNLINVSECHSLCLILISGIKIQRHAK